MQHILPKNRQQYEFISLEDFIDKNNPVRFVDAFVEKLELNKLGFKLNTVKTEGRPTKRHQCVFNYLLSFVVAYLGFYCAPTLVFF